MFRPVGPSIPSFEQPSRQQDESGQTKRQEPTTAKPSPAPIPSSSATPAPRRSSTLTRLGARQTVNDTAAAPSDKVPEGKKWQLPAFSFEGRPEGESILFASTPEDVWQGEHRASRSSPAGSSPPAASNATSSSGIEEIARDAAPSPAADIAATAPVRQGPVFNQDGTIHRANLQSFIGQFVERLPALPENVPATVSRRHERLKDALARIPSHVPDSGPASADQLMAIRDAFDAAARDACKLADSFLGRRHPVHRDAQAAWQYSNLGAQLVELKRIHLTGAAPTVMNHHVKRGVANWLSAVPTIGHMTSSSISKDSGLGASHSIGLGSIEISGTKNQTLWNDDDRDLNFWNALGLAVKGGGPNSWLFRLSLKLRGEAGGTYFETGSLEEMMQLMLNREANQSLFQRSASPESRRPAFFARKGYNFLVKNVAAHNYADEAGMPLYLNDKKLGKGFSPDKLHLFGTAFDFVARNDTFASLLQQAYPTTAQRLKGEAGDGVFKEPLSATVPVSDPIGHGPLPYRYYNYLNVSTGIGKTKELGDGVGIGGDVSANLSGYTFEFHLQNPEASHSLLDPAYHADMAATFQLVTQLDALLASPQPPARLHLYRQTRDALGHDTDEAVPAADVKYYGAENTIPRQFRDAITNGNAAQLCDRIGQIGDECGKLRALYLDFVDNAARLAAKPDKYTPAQARTELENARKDAFHAINQAIWGAGEDGNTGYPGGLRQALKDPEKFLAETHDALGLALGCSGIHLAVAKRRLTQLVGNAPDAAQKDQARTAIQQADKTYAQTKNLLDKTYLPMKKIDVYLKKPTFEDRGLSQRHNLLVNASATTLFNFNFAELIARRFGKSMGDYSITNEAGQIALTAQCRYQHAKYQINPSRQGDFLEFKFTAQGGQPLTGPLIAKGIMWALKKLHPEADIEQMGSHFMQQLQGLALDATAGGGVVCRLRHFPKSDRLHFDFQYLRVFETKTSGVNIGIPIPTPVGLFKAKWTKQVTLQNAVYETMGPDVGYLMLQHKKLKEAIETSKSNAKRSGLDENDVLKAQFHGTVDSNPALASGFEGNKNAKWVADSYFSSSTLIPAVIDRYMDYARAATAAEARGETLENGATPNEFYRYFERNTEEEPFRRVAEYSAEAKHHAPGASVNWTDKGNEQAGTPHDPFAAPPNLLARIGMPDLPSGRTWEAEKAHIRGLSFKERIDYFCSPAGRPVLDTFCKIIETTKSVHDTSRHRVTDTTYGFRTQLKSSAERSQAKAALDDPSSSSTANSWIRRAANRLRREGLQS